MNLAKQVLSEHKIRCTAVRQEVIQLFIDAKSALAQSDIEKQLAHKFDRVTVYRTLKTFNEVGLIHEVIDNEAVVKYAWCGSCEAHRHVDRHIHFKCSDCSQTYCLHQTVVAPVLLPEGFSAKDYHILVVGQCRLCKKN